LRVGPLNISTLIVGVFIFFVGFSIAALINSYLEYRFFSLPTWDIKGKKENTSPKKTDYRYLSYVIKETPAKNTGKNAGEDGNIPSEKENLKLIGTLKINNQYYALIKAGDNIKLVKEGDHIDGFIIRKIEKFYVDGEEEGRKYRLSISIKKSGKMTVGRNDSYRLHKEVDTSEEVVKLDRRFVEEKTADIGKLMKDVLIQPVVKDGKTIGFMFRYVKPNSLLYKLGLRSGDMIVSVNGRSIKTVEEAFKIYNILRNENTVEVVIKRKGKEKTLVFEIQ